MPEARTLLEATVEAGNLARAAAARCMNVCNSQCFKLKNNFSRELHQEGLEEAAGGEKPYLNPATLEVGGYNYI